MNFLQYTGRYHLFWFLIGFVSCDIHHHHEGAHEHGSVQVRIAMEDDRSAHLEIEAPSYDLWGFGHRPGSEKEKARQEGILELFRNNPEKLFSFSDNNGCLLTVDGGPRVVYQEHADEHSGHSHLLARYTINCKKAISGEDLYVGLSDDFSTVQKIHFTILSDQGQRSETIHGADGSVRLQQE